MVQHRVRLLRWLLFRRGYASRNGGWFASGALLRVVMGGAWYADSRGLPRFAGSLWNRRRRKNFLKKAAGCGNPAGGRVIFISMNYETKVIIKINKSVSTRQNYHFIELYALKNIS
jgi:hypothetical protein